MNKECQNCRQLNPSEAAFCLNCAAPLPGGRSGGGARQAAQPQNQQNFASPPGVSSGASGRAVAALVLAVLGLICCGPLTSIPAAILGWIEMNAIKQGQSPASGMWMAKVGLWSGIAITVIQIAGFFLWLLLSLAAVTSEPYYY